MGRMAQPDPLTPNPALWAGDGAADVPVGHPWGHGLANIRRHSTDIPGRAVPLWDVPAKSSPQGQGQGAPWGAWLQPRWSNPGTPGALTQLY